MPKISVIMPVYNGEKYLKEAIDSILSQTYTDFEFIIINDCSTDSTEEIILSYTDSRIRYLKNESNLRIARTLNKGIELAQGEYIARMDADDIADTTRFEKQVTYMDANPQVGVLGSSVSIFGEGIASYVFSFSADGDHTKADLFFSNALAHPTVMIRRQALKQKRYDSNYEGLEDYVLWWEMAQQTTICSLAEPLLKYRRHRAQVTQTYTDEFRTKFRQFLKLRLNVLNDIVEEDDLDIFEQYCLYNTHPFTSAEIHLFLFFLKKQLKNNLKKHFFSQKCLKHVFGLAWTQVIQFSCSKKHVKIMFLLKGWLQGVIGTVHMLKVFRHYVIG